MARSNSQSESTAKRAAGAYIRASRLKNTSSGDVVTTTAATTAGQAAT